LVVPGAWCFVVLGAWSCLAVLPARPRYYRQSCGFLLAASSRARLSCADLEALTARHAFDAHREATHMKKTIVVLLALAAVIATIPAGASAQPAL
jgi:hypothetical protein